MAEEIYTPEGVCSGNLKSELEAQLRERNRVIELDELEGILGSTIKHDSSNKVITFLAMLLTYTEADQINIGYSAESSTGKSYIPLELAWYFRDVLEYSYVSPTAFFHEYGELATDPTDVRDVEDDKKHRVIKIDLERKVLIFMDQPHDMLLQRLRPLLSHDRKVLAIKITDRSERKGMRTKTVLIKGYPTVLFCTAKFSMEDQERTRLLLLSPETTPEKIKDAVLLKIQKESEREKFSEYMENDPKRRWLRSRVDSIASSCIDYINIDDGLQRKISERFFAKRINLVPRHQRDISRLLALIKANALLNCNHRKRLGDTITVDEKDVEEGFRLYDKVSLSNELGLPPEVYEIYDKMKQHIGQEGITKKEFSAKYYKLFHRVIGSKRLDEVWRLLTTVGLYVEEIDSVDHRFKRLVPCYPHVEEDISEEECTGKIESSSRTVSRVTSVTENSLVCGDCAFHKTHHCVEENPVLILNTAIYAKSCSEFTKKEERKDDVRTE